MLQLVRPSMKYADNYRQVMTKLKEEGSFDYEGTLPDIEGAIRKWQELASTEGGATHLWLVSVDQYLGFFEFDHRLLSEISNLVTWQIQHPVVSDTAAAAMDESLKQL